MGRIVLVTGVSRYLGGRFARELANTEGVDRVIGVDVVAPSYDLGRAEFVRADIRNPVVARIIAQADVDTVAHLSVSSSAVKGAARVSQKEINVIGTMQLLAACQASPTVKRLVLKSTGSVYGSSAASPALFSEEMPLRSTGRTGFVRDAIEVEGYVSGVRRRRPDLEVTILRMAHVIGPHIDTSLTDYFRRSVIPIPFGYDGRLQLLHEEDAITALLKATTGPPVGVVNVAADGVLTLYQAAALVRRLPMPVMSSTGRMLGRSTFRRQLAEVAGEQIDFLLWGRVLDTTRMRQVLGVAPEYSTRAAFADFAEHVDAGVPGQSVVVQTLDSVASMLLDRLQDRQDEAEETRRAAAPAAQSAPAAPVAVPDLPATESDSTPDTTPDITPDNGSPLPRPENALGPRPIRRRPRRGASATVPATLPAVVSVVADAATQSGGGA